jgi:hypothetical protein
MLFPRPPCRRGNNVFLFLLRLLLSLVQSPAVRLPLAMGSGQFPMKPAIGSGQLPMRPSTGSGQLPMRREAAGNEA